MQDRELYQRIAGGIAPWTVGEIKVDSAGQVLEVQVECSDAVPQQCPHCDCMSLVSQHGEEQTWRQPDAGSWQILLKGRLPLVECPEHGVVRVSPPWADWYVRGQDKTMLGPWSLQQIKLLLDVGRISPSTLLKRGSSSRWVIAGTVPALFVRQEEIPEPALSIDELAAVDWAIANDPAASVSMKSADTNSIAAGGDTSVFAQSHPSDRQPADDATNSSADRSLEKATRPLSRELRTRIDSTDQQKVRPAIEDRPNSKTNDLSAKNQARSGTQGHHKPDTGHPVSPPPLVDAANPGQSDLSFVLQALDDLDGDAAGDSVSNLKSSRSSAPRELENLPDLSRESIASGWSLATDQPLESEHTANFTSQKVLDETVAQLTGSTSPEPEQLRVTSEESNVSEWSLAIDRAVALENSADIVPQKPVDAVAAERNKSALHLKSEPAVISPPRSAKKLPGTREESSLSEWNQLLKRAVQMEHAADVVPQTLEEAAPLQRLKAAPRVKSAPRGKTARREKSSTHIKTAPSGKAASRRDALVRRRGFQDGYQLLTIAYLVNSCVVCCLVPAACMVFFSRLLILSASVFIPFEGGNALREGQLVECGLSAFSVLVIIGFPFWHLISNGGVLRHYGASALVGMIAGFGLSPDYLDEVCGALKWFEFGFGLAAVGLMVHTLLAVPAQSRMSLPVIAAVLLTGLSAMTLCFVRTGSMLTVQASVIPPQFQGALPDAPLLVLGLSGTLVLIPVAILFELYQHSDYSSRQFIIRTGLFLGGYLLVGIATLGSFVHGAGTGFFDVPIALLPLGCVNALAASIPSAMFLLDPQYSVSQD